MRRLNWPNIIIALVVLLIAIGVFFVFRKSPEDKTDLATKTAQQQKQQAAKKDPAATDDKPVASNDGRSAPAAAPAPTPSAVPATPAPAAQPLAKTGPAETTQLFIGSVVLGSLAFHFVQRRRISISL